jgi:hypothetical protein
VWLHLGTRRLRICPERESGRDHLLSLGCYAPPCHAVWSRRQSTGFWRRLWSRKRKMVRGVSWRRREGWPIRPVIVFNGADRPLAFEVVGRPPGCRLEVGSRADYSAVLVHDLVVSHRSVLQRGYQTLTAPESRGRFSSFVRARHPREEDPDLRTCHRS